MKNICIFIYFLIILSGLSADSRWVISVGGLKMRNEPNFESSKVTVIPYCGKVEIRTDSPGAVGHWSPVSWNGFSGWVHTGFLSSDEPEPLSAIKRLDSRESRLVGQWYKIPPFDREEKKCTEIPPIEFYSPLSYCTRIFSGDRNYRGEYYEGIEGGTWSLSGNRITINGKKASISEDSPFGYEDSPFYRTQNVEFYKIRDDWIVMEVMEWIAEDYLMVDFWVKPNSSGSAEKVQNWYPG